ncbi:MAG: hypothetical protein ACE5GU_13950 [Candidatus Scalinduaceae bacterium]
MPQLIDSGFSCQQDNISTCDSDEVNPAWYLDVAGMVIIQMGI